MASSNVVATIQKLKGRDDYDSWKFVVQAYLESEGLWSIVKGTSTEANEDKKKEADSKARGKIVMMIDSTNYSHIRNAKNAKETWDCLETAFEDRGFSRQVSLLRELVTTKLGESKSMDDYLNRIVTCVHKLKGAGSEISDELTAAFMMAGLTENYRPMIMGIESSNVKITSDQIKTKLLQEVLKNNGNDNEESALVVEHRTHAGKFNKCFECGHDCQTAMNEDSYRSHASKMKCYECGKEGHFARNCKQRKNFNNEEYDQERVSL